MSKTIWRGAARSAALVMFAATGAWGQAPLRLMSPDGRTAISVAIREGHLTYDVRRDARAVLTPSRLGFELRGGPALRDGLRITGHSERTHDETWTQPWGEVARVRDHHNEMRVEVEEANAPNRRFSVIFRAFDDGLGFRYELPAQPGFGDYEISDELTEFAFADNGRAW
ncbi:MAG TPA: glycoside hydrolase family 97 N-terminal domain-containing protein, partial [Gemmatimonadaceae bacterium]|nr:glycoside hydrolase family 97 N-terminal domain-containing protein [Gemmatimonadaceae bacterium]